ncbi:MAG: hypothetical protein Q8S26_06490 [Azonexus sp.]|nr:hypothetical protein [Azonexus sp.]
MDSFCRHIVQCVKHRLDLHRNRRVRAAEQLAQLMAVIEQRALSDGGIVGSGSRGNPAIPGAADQRPVLKGTLRGCAKYRASPTRTVLLINSWYRTANGHDRSVECVAP